MNLPVSKETAATLPAAERARIAEDLRRLNVAEIRFDRHDQLLYSTNAFRRNWITNFT